MVFALIAAQVLFFFYVAVFPLSTVGEPAFDRPWLRVRTWIATQQIWIFGISVILAVLMVLRQGGLRVIQTLLALMPLCLAHVVLVSEVGLLIRHGGLAVTPDTALLILNFTRPGCVVLALVSLIAIWRVNARGFEM